MLFICFSASSAETLFLTLSRRDSTLQVADIQVGTPRRGKTQRISAK
jgi:hypothetical protein